MVSPLADIDSAAEPGFDRRGFLRSLAILGGALTIAAALLWWRFGGLIFFDMLASLQGCF